MRYFPFYVLLMGSFFWMNLSVAQHTQEGDSTFDVHYERSLEYAEASLFAQAMEELDKSIKIASQIDRTEAYARAIITKAEYLRKTGDNAKGLELLREIEEIELPPELYVRLLGRKAALIHEQHFEDHEAQIKQVLKILSEAIQLAEQYDLEKQEGHLRQELGYLLMRRGEEHHDQAYSNLLKGANLFEKNNDDASHSGILVKLLEYHIGNENEASVDSIYKIITRKSAKKNWYTMEADLYSLMSGYWFSKNDSVSGYQSRVKSLESVLKHREAIQNNRMETFRVLYETNKMKQLAEKQAGLAERKKEELIKEKGRTVQLTILLTTLIILAVILIFLLIRERSLKKQVKVANDKYQMLILESNHRIKNNLQMITSLIKYLKKTDPNNVDSSSLDNVSGKVHAISSLHKHLSINIHNQKVLMQPYFDEILSFYEQMFPEKYVVKKEFTEVWLRSESLVYFGLCFNEMLSNSFEHGSGESLTITVTNQEGTYKFVYQDDSKLGLKNTPGTGTLLISELIERIGGFDYQFDPAVGRYQFSFYAKD